MALLLKKETLVKRISSLNELDDYFKTLKNIQEYSLVSYIYQEYGFFPIFFNELFEEFFQDCQDELSIATCFPGHEFFYEDKVDILLILDGFIDTTRAYKDSKKTKLYEEKCKFHASTGIAFWFTIRNFDEDEYQQIVDSYSFKRELFSIGKKKLWYYHLHPGPRESRPYQYARGEFNKEYWLPKNITPWQTKKKLGWNIEKWQVHNNYPRVVSGEYDLIFVKNSYKTLSNDGKKRFGYIENSFLQDIISFYIKKKRRLLILHDLVEYPVEKNEYIEEVRMMNFFDTKYFLSLVHHANIFISSSTSPIDLAAYYCNTNLLLLDDLAYKVAWVGKILQLRGKRCASCGSRTAVHAQQAMQFIDTF